MLAHAAHAPRATCACTVRPVCRTWGVSTGSRTEAETISQVPVTSRTTPGRNAPTGRLPHRWSWPPRTTGVPGARPVALAASAVTSPRTVVLGWASGMRRRSILARPSNSSDQSSRFWSKSIMQEAML
ncbi:MAG: hypothetical protein AMS14_09725 [Planctomycetes bacterium DG_20]|nr:MAG: hypothetical protein AMS14_09725 [Planctomycetes bacterium DG_20]